MQIHIEGLEIYAYHGALPEEKALGQPFIFDLEVDIGESEGAITDRVHDTVDYTDIIDTVSEVATAESYNLLERLAQVVAETLMERFSLERVWVKVTKVRPPVPVALAGVAASLELERGDAYE